jgi:CRISPR/Cas system-associated endonuclease Cas3-HD
VQIKKKMNNQAQESAEAENNAEQISAQSRNVVVTVQVTENADPEARNVIVGVIVAGATTSSTANSSSTQSEPQQEIGSGNSMLDRRPV